MALTPRSVFRKFVTDGVPSSGKHKPEKDEIIQLLEQLFGVSRGGWVVARTLAELQGITPGSETDGGVVLTGAGAGYYEREGGAWVFGRGFPDTFARVELSGSGTAQTGVVMPGVVPANVEVFFAFVATENTGPLTLAIGGEEPREVVNLAGSALAAGEWTGTVMFALKDGKYQLLLDAGAALSAAQSASEAAQSAAEAENQADRAEIEADRAATNAMSVVDRAWFKTVADLLADDNGVIGYEGSGAQFIVVPGDIIETQGFRYEVASSDATDAHLETAGGVKLYEAGPVFTHIDRMARLAGSAIISFAELVQEGRGGVFIWDGSDLSAMIERDPARGVYVPPVSDPTGASGAWVRRDKDEVNPFMFGAAGDYDFSTGTGTDDSDAIEAMINYCSPFEWKGNRASTLAAAGDIRAIARGGVGNFRITRPMPINPWFSWEGMAKGTFVAQNAQTVIVADWDGKDDYAFDAAPYDTNTGERLWGVRSSNNTYLSGGYAECRGWSLRRLRICAASGRNLKGGINRAVSIGSEVEKCLIQYFNIGIDTNTCWGGVLRDNFVQARAIGLSNFGVTNDNQQNNYVIISGTPPVAGTEFDWPDTTSSAFNGKTACVYNDFSRLKLDNNTLEHGQIGIFAKSYGLRADFNYMENITEVCYGLVNAPIHSVVGVTNCPSATFVNVPSSGTVSTYFFDFNAVVGDTLRVETLAVVGSANARIDLNGMIAGTATKPVPNSSSRVRHLDYSAFPTS